MIQDNTKYLFFLVMVAEKVYAMGFWFDFVSA